jgi:nucleoid DNA-binding protein
MTIRRKHDLDALVAEYLGFPRKEVRAITTAFLSALIDALSDFEDVHLDSFGRFRLVAEKPQKGFTELRKGTLTKNGRGRKMLVKVKRKFRVHFAKSDIFKRILREKHGPNAKEKKS